MPLRKSAKILISSLCQIIPRPADSPLASARSLIIVIVPAIVISRIIPALVVIVPHVIPASVEIISATVKIIPHIIVKLLHPSNPSTSPAGDIPRRVFDVLLGVVPTTLDTVLSAFGTIADVVACIVEAALDAAFIAANIGFDVVLVLFVVAV